MTQPAAPEPAAPLAPPAVPQGIRAVSANRAALTILLVQALGASLMISWGLDSILAFLLTAALNLLLLATVFRQPFNALRQDSRWRTPPGWGLALGVFVVAFMASRAWAVALTLLLPSVPPADTVNVLAGSQFSPWLMVLAGGVIIPLIEEIAFRGLMLRGHERAAGFMTAALTTTLAFSLAHGVPLSVAGILPLAYALARLVQHTGSLWNSVIVHALNNGLALALVAALGDRLPLDNAASAGTELTASLGEGLRVPAALGAFLFGAALLTVLHLWLTPRPDPQERQSPGPWLSGAYLTIIIFGLWSMAMASSPDFSAWFINLLPRH